MLPELYLHELSTGDFDLALRGLPGEGAPLSASSIQRLKGRFEHRLERPGEIPGALPDLCLDSFPDGLPLLQPQALLCPSTFFVATETAGNTTGLARNWRPHGSTAHAARRILPVMTCLSNLAVIRLRQVEN